MGMILQTQDLAFGYAGSPSTLFEAVDLEIAAGETICILGPNGVGKSTLLRCLCGLIDPSSGRVLLDGEPLARLSRPAIARRLAFVAQSDETVFAFPVRTVVEMGAASRLGAFSSPGAEVTQAALAALSTLGIEHLASAAYTEISGGERQLVQIARVLVQSAALTILDEPTAHLDFANQARFLALLRRLALDGMAVIFTTHDPDQAFALADRTLVLSRHRSPRIGATLDTLTEECLRETYRIPIRLIETYGQVRAVATGA